MKKLLFSVLSVLVAMNMSAITYLDQVSITLDDGTYLPNLVVGESDDLPDGAIQNGYAAEVQDLSAMPLAVYALFDGTEYTSIAMKSLANMPIGIKTSSATDYTFYFDDVIGSKSITIYDAVENYVINVVEGGDYAFSAPANSIINNRFFLFYTAADYTVTTNAYGWSTFAVGADVNWLVSESPELKAYSGLVSADASALDLYEIAVADAVPAGEGVIFHGAANTTYNLYNAASATPIASNDLIGCTADKDVTAESNVFVLSGNAFQEYTGSYIPAGKAYIHVNTGSAAPAQRMAIRIHPVATGVEAVAGEAKAEKVVRDGQLLILRDGKTYNVQGQIVK